MKKKLFFSVVLAMVLVFGMTVVGCKKSGGTSTVNTGTLTVNNCPANATVMVCINDAPTTMMQIVRLILEPYAVGHGDNSPFKLLTINGNNFTETESFLVVLQVDSDIYFIEDVSFTNGFGTVDYNSMKPQTSLPAF